MVRYYRVAPEAGLARDEEGNPEACYARVEGEAAEDITRTLDQFGIRAEHLTEISEADYIAATGESIA